MTRLALRFKHRFEVMKKHTIAIVIAIIMLLVGWILNAIAWAGIVEPRPFGRICMYGGVGLLLLGGFLLLLSIIALFILTVRPFFG